MRKRYSGILMHITSLNGEYGIGSLGKSAIEFIDFLDKAGQKYWQILPLGHTSYGDSPYQCFSAFAGNPNLIDLEILKEEKLLITEDFYLVNLGENDRYVDYGKIFKEKTKLLRKAFERFHKEKEEYIKFKKENEFWLNDYSEYMAIKDSFDLKPWFLWDEKIRNRDLEALQNYRESLKDDIEFYKFIQYEFFYQWKKVKDYANRKDILIIGDLPIYVAMDSADMWSNPKMFKVDDKNEPITVAGCPPDAFSEDGQLWGNPIYNWEKIKEDGFSWWVLRVKESLKLYDLIRLDHFIGFNSYYEIPYGEKTAKNGKWSKGPKLELFNKIKEELGEMDIIGEDLGIITEEFLEFKNEIGCPGMNVLQFAFGYGDSKDLPHNHRYNSVSYLGTHDNETILGWFKNNIEGEEGKKAKEYFMIDGEEEVCNKFIRGILGSNSKISIMTMQDILNVGNEGRFNTPSTIGGNWTWRILDGEINEELEKYLYKITSLYGRLN